MPGFSLSQLYRVALAWVLLIMCPQLIAQGRSIHFKRITSDQGLSQSMVNDIIKDRLGFMWFGTEGGLNRWDGYSMEVYKHDPDNPYSIPNNRIISMLPGENHTIWIGTGDGLCLFDHETGLFTKMNLFVDDVKVQEVNTLAAGPGTTFWIGADKGLLYYNGEAFQVIDALNGMQIAAIHVTARGDLWLGSEAGLFRHGIHSGETRQYNHDPNDPTSLSHPIVTDVLTDNKERIWVSTWGGGLNLFDPEKEAFAHFRRAPHDPYSISDDDVWAIHMDKRGRLWAGTESGGINQFDSETGHFKTFRHDPSDPNGLSNDSVGSIFEDETGLLWLGSWGGGVNVYNPEIERFIHYKHHPSENASISNSDVLSILEDQEGILWIGTGGGLNRMDRSEGSVARYLHDPNEPGSIADDDVWCLAQGDEGVIWVGTGNGLDRFDVITGQFTHFVHDPDNPYSLSDSVIWSLNNTGDGYLWIGTGYGLNRFEIASGRVTRYQHDPNDPSSLPSNNVFPTLLDNQGRFWVGTYNGLTRMDRETERFQRFMRDPNSSNTISQNQVMALVEGRAGEIWVGTNGGGLNRYDPERDAWSHYRSENGLVDDQIVSMVADASGSLWIGTMRGLAQFDPLSDQFVSYFADDGLQDNEFREGSVFVSSSGEIFFGGVKGFNTFFPETLAKARRFRPPLLITKLDIANKPVLPRAIQPDSPLVKPVYLSKNITLEPHQNMLSFEFTALNFGNHDLNRYAYKLEGIDDQWIPAASNRIATYSRIPPGDYNLMIRASDDQGSWTQLNDLLRIHINPPFWQTWWAFLIYGLIVLGGVGLYVWAQESTKRSLERKVSERTLELDIRNKALAAQNQELATLDGIVQTINSNLDLHGVAMTLLEQGRLLFPKAEKAVFLYQFPGTGKFRCLATLGYSEKSMSKFAFPLEAMLKQYAEHFHEIATGVFISISLEKLVGRVQGWAIPESRMVMSLPWNKKTIAFIVWDSPEPDAFHFIDTRKPRRFRDHAISAFAKARSFKDLVETQNELVEAAHLAGMAEIASDVLHNVGNSLNSIRVSIQVLNDRDENNRHLDLLERLSDLLNSQASDLASFFANDGRSKHVPEAIQRIAKELRRQQDSFTTEHQKLQDQLSSLNKILDEQQKYSHLSGRLPDTVDLNEIITDSLQAELLLMRENQIQTEFDLEDGLPAITSHKPKLIRVLVCILKNAREAILERAPEKPLIRFHTKLESEEICLTIKDNGAGIIPENLLRIFEHGFTTKDNAKGFGLHYSANTLKEMSARIEVESEGDQCGAKVKLRFPLASIS